jgi:charged multivesicular body protein 7
LSIAASEELEQALYCPEYGVPSCMPVVFRDAVRNGDMMLRNEFLRSKVSIYHKSWLGLPTLGAAVQWGLRQVRLMNQPTNEPPRLDGREFVLIKNVEAAANEVLKMAQFHSTADRVISTADFMKRFAHVLNPAAPLTENDVDVLLKHLARDRQAITYNESTVKFKLEHEVALLPITKADEAFVELRSTIATINAQVVALQDKVAAAQAAAREAVNNNQNSRAKAALRSRKLAEDTLAHRLGALANVEATYARLEQGADEVQIVKALDAATVALKGIYDQLGGAEGVAAVYADANEQMNMNDEINVLMSGATQYENDEDIEDEFEALEKAENEKKEQEKAAMTAAQLAQLAEADRLRKEHERRTTGKDLNKSFEQISFSQENDDEDMEDAEEEERVAIPA